MRAVALFLILVSLPFFIALLRRYPGRRTWAFALLTFMFFLGTTVQVGSFLYAWPTWPSPVRGLQVSLVDTLSLALILTRPRSPWRLPFWGLFGFYGAIILLSSFGAEAPVAALFALWQLLTLLLLFVAVGGESHQLEVRKALITGLSLGGLLQAGFVIHQKLAGAVQAAGTMSHQNLLGMMVELAVLPMLASLLAGDRRKIVMAGTAAFLLVIAGGGSRGTVAFAIGGIVFLTILSFIRNRTPGKFKILGIGVLAFAVAAPLTVATLYERFGRGSGFSTSDESRDAMERAARAISADYPLGIGANQYVVFANKYGYSARAGVQWGSGTLAAPVHNAYLLARVETGWIGLFAFALMLGLPAIRGFIWALASRVGERGEAVLGSSTALLVNLVHNNWEYVVFTNGVLGLIFINIAIIAAAIGVGIAPVRRRKVLNPPDHLVSHPAAPLQATHRPSMAIRANGKR